LGANRTTSFFFVSGFGIGAYLAKLLAGTGTRSPASAGRLRRIDRI
jgi:hypothetical protein